MAACQNMVAERQAGRTESPHNKLLSSKSQKSSKHFFGRNVTQMKVAGELPETFHFFSFFVSDTIVRIFKIKEL